MRRIEFCTDRIAGKNGKVFIGGNKNGKSDQCEYWSTDT